MLTDYQKDLITRLTYTKTPVRLSVGRNLGKTCSMSEDQVRDCKLWYFSEWHSLKRNLNSVEKLLSEVEEHEYRRILKQYRKKIHAHLSYVKKRLKTINILLSKLCKK